MFAADHTAVHHRRVGDLVIDAPDPDVEHVVIRHVSGALSSLVSSHAVQGYRCPGLELYGTDGTVSLIGDDWDPRGVELLTAADGGSWRTWSPPDTTWLWTDGLRELVAAVREDRAPSGDIAHDLHLLDVLEAADVAARESSVQPVTSGFGAIALPTSPITAGAGHVHDRSRPGDEQR